MTSFEGFGVVSNFLVMPMYFLSGAIYPLDNLPIWLKTLTTINPLTYGVDLMRGQIIDLHHYPVIFNLLAIGVFGMITLSLAVYFFDQA